MNGITIIKYPIKESFLEILKHDKFFIADRIESNGKFFTVFPKTDIKKVEITEKNPYNEQVVYPKENKIGFYCKNLKKSEILKFKGGFNYEIVPKKERQEFTRKHFFNAVKQMPRKIKKNLIGLAHV
jgi:hypothetical protein